MLLEFTVRNYRSIRDKHSLSMVANRRLKRVPGWIAPSESRSDPQVLTAAVIYGANASGKSNFLRAFYFLTRYVRSGITASKPGEPTGTTPFLFDDISEKLPSEFQVSFIHEGHQFSYTVKMDRKRIIEEALEVWKGNTKGAFQRTYSSRKKSFTWKQSGLLADLDITIRDKTRDNVLFLSMAAEYNQSIPKIAHDWCARQARILNMSVNSNNPQSSSSYTATRSSTDRAFQEKVAGLLRRADLGILDFTAVEQRASSKKLFLDDNAPAEVVEYLATILAKQTDYQVKFQHRSSRKAAGHATLGLGSQSVGTQRLFALAGPILDSLENGYTLVIDEVDASMHPALVRQILDLFSSVETNPKGAQIICTTHDVTLLDTDWLRRDQIWFFQKESDGASTLYSLADFRAVKNESVMRGYLGGRYGAVPKIAKLYSG